MSNYTSNDPSDTSSVTNEIFELDQDINVRYSSNINFDNDSPLILCPLCGEEIENFQTHIIDCRNLLQYQPISLNLVDGHFLLTYHDIDENDYELNSRICETLGNVKVGLKQDHIENISFINLHKKSDKCLVCLEKMFDTFSRKLICSHEFCDACIKKWFEENKTCPVCKWEFE